MTLGALPRNNVMPFRTVFPRVALNAFVVMPNHIHGMFVTMGSTRVVAPYCDPRERALQWRT